MPGGKIYRGDFVPNLLSTFAGLCWNSNDLSLDVTRPRRCAIQFGRSLELGVLALSTSAFLSVGSNGGRKETINPRST
jgi:hypothetical protein